MLKNIWQNNHKKFKRICMHTYMRACMRTHTYIKIQMKKECIVYQQKYDHFCALSIYFNPLTRSGKFSWSASSSYYLPLNSRTCISVAVSVANPTP
jgi:hypothetical protein